MSRSKAIRKIQVKTITLSSRKWEWRHTSEMTQAQSLAQAAEIVKADGSIYAVKTSRLDTHWNWVEEFSGDRNFNYIGIEV